jgi:hypothetical protein
LENKGVLQLSVQQVVNRQLRDRVRNKTASARMQSLTPEQPLNIGALTYGVDPLNDTEIVKNVMYICESVSFYLE